MIFNLSFSQTTYTFIGNGNWTISNNWNNNTIPPSVLPTGSIINIDPISGGICVLNTAQTISPGATINIATNANFLITDGVIINAIIPTLTT